MVADRQGGVAVDDGADLPGFVPSEADRRLQEVYGDTIHLNDGTHLDGGIADDGKWQERWRRIASKPQQWYEAPAGAVGRRL
eukprot:14978887-Ditylum_brightwellii.AAC.1